MTIKQKNKEKIKEVAKEKLERIRGLEKNYNEKKKLESELIKRKLEKIRKKQQEILEEKEIIRREMEIKAQIKQNKLEILKQEKDKANKILFFIFLNNLSERTGILS